MLFHILYLLPNYFHIPLKTVKAIYKALYGLGPVYFCKEGWSVVEAMETEEIGV